LELFRMRIGVDAVEATKLIPEKWFGFGGLENYQCSVTLVETSLCSVRDQLTFIIEDDFSNISALIQKAAYFFSIFSTLKSLKNLLVTDNRKEALNGKRHEKRSQSTLSIPPLTSEVLPVWVGPRAPIQREDETRRITNISDPSRSSAGSRLFLVFQERESEELGNPFCSVAITALFQGDPSLTWSSGRPIHP
jgi:hypothetical protein